VLPGFISVNVIRPSSGAQREYLSIFRFDSSASLMAWEQSDARCEWLKKYRTVCSRAKPTDGKNGARILVYAPEAYSPTQPPRHKMVIVLVIVIAT
jgi:uncharacterized protein